MSRLSEIAVRAFSSSVEFVLVEQARIDLAVGVRRELLVGNSPEIALAVGLYRMPVVPEKKQHSLQRQRSRLSAALNNCCLPGSFANLIILPKGNKPEFTKRMRTYINFFRRATTKLKKSWKLLTSEAQSNAIDLLQYRYHKTEEKYRGPDFDRLAREFLDRFAKRAAKGPAIELPTWTFLQVLGSSSTVPRIVGYERLSVRLGRFLSDAHTAAVELLQRRIGFAVSLDPTAYATPIDFQHKYSAAFASLSVALWWQWFDVFQDSYSKEVISAVGSTWEKLRETISSRKRLAPGAKMTRLKKLTSKLRGSCLEALQRLASHPAVGLPPVLSGGVK